MRSFVCIALCAACGGRGHRAVGDAGPATQAPPQAPSAEPAAPAGGADEGDDAGADSPATAAASPGGEMAAWEAVIERADLLARRGRRGVAIGRLGGDAGPGPYRWLVDDGDGAGSLAIRVVLPAGVTTAAGTPVAVPGAWRVDDARAWVWQAEALEPRGPAQADFSPAAAHTVPTIEHAPDGVVPLAEAKVGAVVVVTVVGAPIRYGDGWAVADRPRAPMAAVLRLPGERPIYGGQEMIAADERWRLEVGAAYAIDVTDVRLPRTAGGIIRLRTAAPPRRIAQ